MHSAETAHDSGGALDTDGQERVPRTVRGGPGSPVAKRNVNHVWRNAPLGKPGEHVAAFSIRMPESVYRLMYQMADADGVSAAELVRDLIVVEARRSRLDVPADIPTTRRPDNQ